MMMMMTTHNTQTEQQLTVTPATAQRLQKMAKQLGKPSLSAMQPLSSFKTWEQETHTLVVLGAKEISNHQAKFQNNQLINQLEMQVEQMSQGLQQLKCTQQFEAETLRLFNVMQKAFQASNTALFQRHWNSWLQVTDLIEQQTTTLYGSAASIELTQMTPAFEPYCLPDWLFEKALPETNESLGCYEQFWLAQQQETTTRLQNANTYNSQVQIKLENWLAAKTAPKCN